MPKTEVTQWSRACQNEIKLCYWHLTSYFCFVFISNHNNQMVCNILISLLPERKPLKIAWILVKNGRSSGPVLLGIFWRPFFPISFAWSFSFSLQPDSISRFPIPFNLSFSPVSLEKCWKHWLFIWVPQVNTFYNGGFRLWFWSWSCGHGTHETKGTVTMVCSDRAACLLTLASPERIAPNSK